MTERYSHLAPEAEHEAVDVLDDGPQISGAQLGRTFERETASS
jgi:hypothetical protein